MRGVFLGGVLAVLSGCVLDTEACGPDFVSEGGLCVPIDPPAPYYPTPATPDGGLPDEGAPPAALPPPGGYQGYDRVRVVDTSPEASIAARAGTPGADLDAVLAVGPNGEFGFGVAVVEDSTVGEGRRAADPGAAVGEPDAATDADVGRFVSLGAGGALTLQLPFAVFSGLSLEVYEASSTVPESYRLEICRADAPPPEGCVVVANDLTEISAVRLP